VRERPLAFRRDYVSRGDRCHRRTRAKSTFSSYDGKASGRGRRSAKALVEECALTPDMIESAQ